MRTTLEMGMLTVALVAACGAVKDPGPPDAPAVSGDDTIYRGMLSDVPPVTFGGGQFCTYTISLRQVEIQITVKPSGNVGDAEARNLNVETVVPPCPFTPQEPSIATYSFASATETPDGTVVMLDAAPTNSPIGVLGLRLTKLVDTYQAHFEYRRTDQEPALNWVVVGSLVLSPQ